MKKHLGYTVGLLSMHTLFRRPKLIKVEYVKTENGIALVAVNAETLRKIKGITEEVITSEIYNDRPWDAYDDLVETRWAFGKLGVDICGCNTDADLSI